MKTFKTKLILLASTSLLTANEVPEIQRNLLDSTKVHNIAVAKDRVTTVSFPQSIAAIDAAFMSLQPDQPGIFQLAHTKGSSFFSVRCLSEKKTARTNLNVRLDEQTYVLMLEQSETPKLSVIFENQPKPVSNKPRQTATPPAVLLALLDKAKAFPFLKKHHPQAVIDVEHLSHKKKPKISQNEGFEIRLQEVFRFDQHDTLVFHLTLRNASEQEILYRADGFNVAVGDQIYPQSISDASGVMKPKTESTIYLAITGTPLGGRNNLSISNEFFITVPLHEEDALPSEIEIHPSK